MINTLYNKVMAGGEITFEEALALSKISDSELYQLFTAANAIREKFTGDVVDLCSIINAKSGHCSEDCKYCAQSVFHDTGVQVYELLDIDTILERAYEMESQGVRRYSLVMSGRGITDKDFEQVLKIYQTIKSKTSLKLCASLGIIDYQKALQLKEVGVTAYHHNLETAESYFPQVCSTHTYQERVETIKAVQKAGLNVCSGGIFSMGETLEQRIEMAFALKDLSIKSVPINILNAIKGTEFQDMKLISPREILKTIAIFRFILPDAFLRIAGGRENALRDLQSMSFLAGINAALVGSYLTTSGRTIKEDLQMITDLGLEVPGTSRT